MRTRSGENATSLFVHASKAGGPNEAARTTVVQRKVALLEVVCCALWLPKSGPIVDAGVLFALEPRLAVRVAN